MRRWILRQHRHADGTSSANHHGLQVCRRDHFRQIWLSVQSANTDQARLQEPEMGHDHVCHQPHARGVLGRSRLQLVQRIVTAMDAAKMDKSCAIAVMAKALRPTHVKTRLVPPLTYESAVTLSASFLRDITENISLAAHHAAIRGYVAYAPAGHEALFDGILAAGTQLVLADGVVDMPTRVQGFGRCLLQAAQRLFERG